MILFDELDSMMIKKAPRIMVEISSRTNYFVLKLIRKFFHKIALICEKLGLIGLIVLNYE
jgi:hypothetical protein